MTTDSLKATQRCAVRQAETDAGRRAIAAHLSRNGLSGTVEFAPKDDDELDQALQAGRFDRAVFCDLDAALNMLWKEKAAFGQWRAAGVQVELADSSGGRGGDVMAQLVVIGESHSRWQRRQIRRQVIAAVILSTAALLALAGLLWLSR